MKNYEEMAKCVFEARDIHIRKQDRQKAMIKRYATVVSELCFSLMIGLIVLNHRDQPPAIPDDIGFTGTTAASYTEKINIISVPPLQTTSYFTEQSKAHKKINNKSEMISVFVNASVTSYLYSDAETVTQIKGEQYRTDAPQIITKADITEPVKTEPVTDVPADTSAPAPVITVIPTKSPEPPPPIPSPDISSDPFHQAPKPINQQYDLAQIRTSAACYMTANIELSSEKIDKRIGIACMSGYDIQKDTYYSCNAEAFSIALAAQTDAVAIKFESSEKYYLYLSDSLDSNSTSTIISSLK